MKYIKIKYTFTELYPDISFGLQNHKLEIKLIFVK